MEKKGDFETATARLKSAEADVEAAKGEVERLQALESFKRITAPFDGTVTERNTDVGALINAGSGTGGGSGPVLFRVVDVHKMRIFVKVPQQMSAGLQEGLTANLYLPQYPDKSFKAIVVTTSHAIDMTSRTLLVELNADNPDDLLQPGTYAEVRFSLPGNPEMMHLPTSALLFRKSGLEVAVVGDDNKVELKKVTVGRNLGTQVEILAGITASDRVVNSPPDSLEAGDLVRLAAEPAASGEQGNLEAEPGPHQGGVSRADGPADFRELARTGDDGRRPGRPVSEAYLPRASPRSAALFDPERKLDIAASGTSTRSSLSEPYIFF